MDGRDSINQLSPLDQISQLSRLTQSGNKDHETAEKLILLYHSGELSEKEQAEVEEMMEGDEELMEFYEAVSEQQDFFQGIQVGAAEQVELQSVSSSARLGSRQIPRQE